MEDDDDNEIKPLVWVLVRQESFCIAKLLEFRHVQDIKCSRKDLD